MRPPSLPASGIGGLLAAPPLMQLPSRASSLASTSVPAPSRAFFSPIRRRRSTSTPAGPPRAGTSASWGSASRNAPWRERDVGGGDRDGEKGPEDDGNDVEKINTPKTETKKSVVASTSVASASASISPSEQASAARASGRPLKINIDLLLVSFVLQQRA